MTKEAVDSIAQGRVWAGKDALEMGLADEKSSLLEAIEYAAGVAGLNKYRIVCYPEKKSFLDEIMGREDKKDAPLVIAESLFKPGFSVMARMPYISIDTNKPTLHQ
jgi:protease-4